MPFDHGGDVQRRVGGKIARAAHDDRPLDLGFGLRRHEGADAVAYHKTAAALSKFSKTGLTDIEDIVPFIRFLVSDGWWMTGQTILVNGGYTTK